MTEAMDSVWIESLELMVEANEEGWDWSISDVWYDVLNAWSIDAWLTAIDSLMDVNWDEKGKCIESKTVECFDGDVERVTGIAIEDEKDGVKDSIW